MSNPENQVVFCPCCGKPSAIPSGSAFCEVGEWDGRQYEVEGQFDKFTCTECSAEFVKL